MNSNRRNFLKILTASLISSNLAACTHKKFFNPDDEIILSGGSYGSTNSLKNALVVINLSQQGKRVINTPFLPHDIIINPNNKYSVFCFEKNGTNACEINLITKNTTRTFKASDNHLFSGHACFSNDGEFIYCVENNIDTYQGSISIINTANLQNVKRLPTLGLSAHQCTLNKQNILTISNTRRSKTNFHQPSLVSIDLKTEKLVERVSLEETDLNCGHFKFTKRNNLIIASKPLSTKSKTLSGGISIRLNEQKITTIKDPATVMKRMIGEALGIAINGKQTIAAITHPDANLMTFWSIKEKKIIKAYGFEKPRGISLSLDKKHFILSYGYKPALVKISAQDLMPLKDTLVQPTLTSGEHIIHWSSVLRDIMPKQVYG